MTKRVRKSVKKVKGTPDRPRLCVVKSLKFSYAQVVDDTTGNILCAFSTRGMEHEKSAKSAEAAFSLGKVVGDAIQAKNIKKVVFDRNGYPYHGRVAAIADGARDAGLQF